MSLIIVDDVNKQFDYFIYVTMDKELQLYSNISKINKKNNTVLQVIPDSDSKYYENLGYNMNQGLYDSLVYTYNSNLENGENPLIRWIE